jgi:serine/threonine-protein kinase HipA
LSSSLETAHHFLLSQEEAHSIFEIQEMVIEKNWDKVCDEAQLSEIDKKLLWRRQFLNPFSIEK